MWHRMPKLWVQIQTSALNLTAGRAQLPTATRRRMQKCKCNLGCDWQTWHCTSNPNTRLFAADLPPAGKTLQRKKRRVTQGCHRTRNCCLLRNTQQHSRREMQVLPLEDTVLAVPHFWWHTESHGGSVAAVRMPDTTLTQAPPQLRHPDLPLPFFPLLNGSATPMGIWWEEHRCHS